MNELVYALAFFGGLVAFYYLSGIGFGVFSFPIPCRRIADTYGERWHLISEGEGGIVVKQHFWQGRESFQRVTWADAGMQFPELAAEEKARAEVGR